VPWPLPFRPRSSSLLLELAEQGGDVVDRVTQIEANVGGHLVVARAAGMQALAGIADERGQAFLDVQVHVFEVE
jgi:hypothetical protein